MRKNILIRIIFFTVFVTTINGWNVSEAKTMDKVSLQLMWNNQFQFAGYYAAQWKGYYRDEGIDVNIKSAFLPNKRILDASQEVMSGRADFGIGAVNILIAENKGADLSVIATIFQRSAVEYYMKAGTPFNSIVDFTRLKTARRENDLLDLELQAMLLSEGIKPRNSNMLPYSYDFNADDLSKNRFQVIPGYLGVISYLAKQQNLKLKEIKPLDYGIDFYGDSLFARRSFVMQNPDLVERFRRASLKGWTYALEHQQEIAGRIAVEYRRPGESVSELKGFNRYQAQRVAALTLYPVVQIGNINPYRWEQIQDVLLKLGIVNGKPDFEKFIFDYSSIIDQRNKNTEKILFGLMIIGFSAFILYFIGRLAAKNAMLKRENAERKMAEEKIIRSTQRYETMFSSAVLGITVATAGGIIIQANRKWLDITGYDEEDVIGHDIEEFIIHVDERAVELKEKFYSGEIESYETEQKYRRKDGKIGWGRLFMTSIYDSDFATKVAMAMVVDITNEKIEEETVRRSERRFRSIINEIASGMPEVYKKDMMLQYEDNGEKTDRSELSLKLERINLELERMYKNEMDENKKKEGLLVYQARLAAMGEMIANIAHQWRQPLNNLGLIISNIEDSIYYDDSDPAEISEAIGRCRKIISSMSDTIDDFRYMLNPRNDKTCFSVSENIKGVLEIFEENLRFNKIKLSIDVSTEDTAYGYANQYSQAVHNIISNSIDALSEESNPDKEISISIYKEGTKISAEIRDNGGGIKEEYKDRIFDVYFTTKTDQKGTGLGLYMTKLIVENNLKGTIELLQYKDGVNMKISIPENGGVVNEGV